MGWSNHMLHVKKLKSTFINTAPWYHQPTRQNSYFRWRYLFKDGSIIWQKLEVFTNHFSEWAISSLKSNLYMVLKESTCTHSAGRMMLYGFPLKEIEFALKKTIKKKNPWHKPDQIKDVKSKLEKVISKNRIICIKGSILILGREFRDLPERKNQSFRELSQPYQKSI